MQLRAFLAAISEQLGDWPDEGGALSYKQWSLSTLHGFYAEALCAIATTYRPREFARVVDVPLTGESVVDLSAYGTAVSRVIGLVDATGATVQAIANAFSAKRDWSTLWVGGCPPQHSAQAVPVTATRVAGTVALLHLTPAPATPGLRLRVVMYGASPPIPALDDDLSMGVSACKYLGAVRNYVMSAALGAQIESHASLVHSADFMKRFVALMSANRVNDSEAVNAS